MNVRLHVINMASASIKNYSVDIPIGVSHDTFLNIKSGYNALRTDVVRETELKMKIEKEKLH